MGVTFTAEQQKVIDLRNSNILVAAAAGSGKTAVLVERIITMLTKDQPAIDVDELLIVTFTEAAAAEMKERVRVAIEKALEENPSDVHLQRQATLIHNAQITTIHSFCLSVIREYFYKIDLDPGFRIGEEGELKLLRQDVIDELLESYYDEGNDAFLDFVESYASGRDDKKIGELILKIYEFSTGYPNAKRWLSECVTKYDVKTVEALDETVFVKLVMDYTSRYLEDIIHTLEHLIQLCEEPEGPRAYGDCLQDDLSIVRSLCKETTFGGMQEKISQVAFKRLAPNRDKSVDEELVKYVQATRGEIKKTLEEMQKQYFQKTPLEVCKDMQMAGKSMAVLASLVEDFIDAYAKEKRNKNLIDFNDMEHMALQILTEEQGDELVPSKIATEFKARFKEVMIDEYQDSNLIQEAILTSVSGVSEGRHNIFMVGDVKQSIYRFRLARPELFMEKFDTYSLTGGNKQRIDLHKNFRSREEVLESANFIFEQIMTRGFGGIEYDDNAALNVGATYVKAPHNETEILLLDEEEIFEIVPRQAEAYAVAKRIKELLKNHKVQDKKTGELRPVQYKDIVILTRNLAGWSDVYSQVLNMEGIPTYTSSRTGYFETLEVTMVLDYLKVLDNPRQDIPFVAVLTCGLVGVTKEELATIKIETQEDCFYDRVTSYIEAGDNETLVKKLQTFTAQMERFRECVPYTSIYELLNRMIKELGYEDYIASLPGGEQRAANIEMLLEKAVAFENTSYKGLFHFVRYIEQLKKYNVDYGEASLSQEEANVVQLMSIHKSKGLEFPIVFVGGMGKTFSKRDVTGSVTMHPELGVGLDAISYERRTTSATLAKRVIQRELILDNAAEELRVLYVAMTRAKEKLIMVGTIPHLKQKLASCEELKVQGEKQLSYSMLTKANSYFDWVIPAVYRHESMSSVLADYELTVPFSNPYYKAKCHIHVSHVEPTTLLEGEIEELIANDKQKESLTGWDTSKTYDADIKMQLENQFSFVYPYERLQKLPQAMSVSELKKRAYEEEQDTRKMFKEQEVFPLLPRFLQEEQNVTGAFRGTEYHRVMEKIDFTKTYDEATIKQISDVVEPTDILGFLDSNLGKRMSQAAKCQKLFKEQPFVLGVDVKDIYPQEEGETQILVEGIIDVYFEEDGELVVADYKTDNVKMATELQERYHAQLEYYAKALEQLTGKKVKEKIIYSFTLHEELEV